MPSLSFDRPRPGEEVELAELRARVMRESLVAAGRFDEVRVRRRFLDTYDPQATWVVRRDGDAVGFYVVEDRGEAVYLAHLYVDRGLQRIGVGAAVLDRVKRLAGNRPIRLNTLKNSPANEFYRRHGFVATGEDEVDRFYEYRPLRLRS